MSKHTAPRNVLGPLSEALTFSMLIGLAAASAAALAGPLLNETAPVVHRLPTVYVTGKAVTPEVVKLPTVVVVGKRST